MPRFGYFTADEMGKAVLNAFSMGLIIGLIAPPTCKKIKTWYTSRRLTRIRKSNSEKKRKAVAKHGGVHRAQCLENTCNEAREECKAKEQKQEAEYQASIKIADPESDDSLERWAAFLQNPENKSALKDWYDDQDEDEQRRQNRVSNKLYEYGIQWPDIW
ncbi:MAG: hypothetical protein Q9226_005476 [Calogaya cf. arnoldii]